MHLCHGQTGTGRTGVGGVGEGSWGEIAANVCLRGAPLMKNERMRSLGKVPGQRQLGLGKENEREVKTRRAVGGNKLR